MQAANEGAAAAPERVQSIGIRVNLPFEQDVNTFVKMAFEHRTFFTRLGAGPQKLDNVISSKSA
jgi:predicted Rossmann-fold nucleotide-binding protein